MKFIRVGLIILFFFCLTSSVFAVTLSIDTYPSSFDQGQEIEIGFSMGCSNCGNSYIRGAFFPDGDNYFGLTQNDSGNLIGTTTDKTQYFKIAKEDVIGSSWSGKLKMKIDVTDALYSGPGNYSFKIGRYTSANSSAFWSGIVNVQITGPSPTPTNSPTSTSTPTNSPQSTVTHTPTQTPKPTNTPTVKSMQTSTPTITGKKTPTPTEEVLDISSSSSVSQGNILGAKDDASATSSVVFERAPSKKVLIITFLFIGIGTALLSLAVVLRKQFFQREGEGGEKL